MARPMNRQSQATQFLRPHAARVPLGNRLRLRRRRAGLAAGERRLLRRRRGGSVAARSRNPLAPKPPRLPAKAKSVIFLFMYGGPSHIDTFDYKPDDGRHGRQDGRRENLRPRRAQERGPHRRAALEIPPVRPVRQMGQRSVPAPGDCVDDIAFLHSMTAESPIHGSAMLMMNSGRLHSGSPALGSWVNYGLGSVNENLPGFVVMLDRDGRPDQRRQELVERLHAGHLRGHGVPRRGLADQRPVAARRA